ncbi:MAG: DUF188 domain-containing protein [Oscillospiraceae bacterium]
MTLLIDADGCPVVNLTISAAKKHGLKCIILCDTSHVFERDGATTVTVSKGADSVDFALVNMVQKGDIAITQDYGLAAMCLARNAIPIRQDGLVFDGDNIDSLLLQRHTAKKIRMGGGRIKGHAKRSPGDDERFCEALEKLIAIGKQSESRDN